MVAMICENAPEQLKGQANTKLTRAPLLIFSKTSVKRLYVSLSFLKFELQGPPLFSDENGDGHEGGKKKR